MRQAGAKQQRVSIGWRLLHADDANLPGRAGAVLDDEALPKSRGQLLCRDARHEVDAATGGKRHDDLNRMRRITFRGRGLQRSTEQCRGGHGGLNSAH